MSELGGSEAVEVRSWEVVRMGAERVRMESGDVAWRVWRCWRVDAASIVALWVGWCWWFEFRESSGWCTNSMAIDCDQA